MQKRWLFVLVGILAIWFLPHVFAADSALYRVPTDVMNSGGGEGAKSTNYVLNDSLGEPIVGHGRTSNYFLESGYRKPSAGEYLSMNCTTGVTLGSMPPGTQRTGSGTCTVYTDAVNGYRLMWSVLTGSGGTNTGYLINDNDDVIQPYNASRSGLTGYWKLDETSAGSAVLDYSGNGYSGTPNGTAGTNNLPQPSTDLPSNTNFRSIRSLDFDGTDDYVAITSAAALASNPISISFWTKNDVNPVLYDGLIAKTNGSTWTQGWGFFYNSASELRFFIERWNANVAFATISPLQWNHVVGTWDGSTIRLYVNGVEGTSDSYGGSITTSNPFEIGRVGTDAYNLDGRIDEVRIYNRVLSANEVKALYNEPQSWSISATIAAWGARLSSRSSDTHVKWGTDGASEKWLNIGDGNFSIITREGATAQAGSSEIVQFRAENGSSSNQPQGVYRSTVIMTVLGY